MNVVDLRYFRLLVLFINVRIKGLRKLISIQFKLQKAEVQGEVLECKCLFRIQNIELKRRNADWRVFMVFGSYNYKKESQ